MALVNIVPGTRLPLHREQQFTYDMSSSARAGSVVSVPFGSRELLGVVTGEHRGPFSFEPKTAQPFAATLAPYALAFARDVAAYYRAPLSLVIKMLLPKDGSVQEVAPQSDSTSSGVPPLTDDQKKVSDQISQTLGAHAAFLLWGVTGSGKTEVYAHVAQQLLAKKKQVLMLVPEIALTPMLAGRLKTYFGDRVMIWHSGLTPKERRSRWQALSKAWSGLIIGPRSALFLPLPRLGLIAMDEEHDGSYKQSDLEPHFNARTVAALLAHHATCPIVYGSATPSLELWHAAQRRSVKRLELPSRYGAALPPKIELVDIRGTPRDISISPASLQALTDVLERGSQAIVLINRRGSARLFRCTNCGEVHTCTSCTRSLVVHEKPRPHLACHYCDQTQALPKSCSVCGGSSFDQRGVGTQGVVRELSEQFPNAKIGRLDGDISRKKAELKAVTKAAAEGAFDILVGTQLVAKGWDVAKLELVIVLNADDGLSVPDFRAHERTIQLLWQAAGRAGRRKTQGRVLIESFQPEHPTLVAIASGKLEEFYAQELLERKKYDLPPYSRLITCTVTGPSDGQRLKREKEVVAELEKSGQALLPGRDVVLPRGKTVRRFGIIVHGDHRPVLQTIPSDIVVDIDPEEL